jgi:CHAT domain-containing protein
MDDLVKRVTKKFASSKIQILCAVLALLELLGGAMVLAQDNPLVSKPIAGDQLMQEGGELYRVGAFERAVETWQLAAQAYAKAEESDKQSDALVALGQGYLALGYSSRAAQSLELALALVQPSKDAARTGRITGVLGQVYVRTGRLDIADEFLREAIQVANAQDDHAQTAVLLNSLGALRQGQGQDVVALQAYQESSRLAQTAHVSDVEGMALLNVARIEQQLGHAAEAGRALSQAQSVVKGWPASHAKADALTTMGLVEVALAEKVPQDKQTHEQSAGRLLDEAVSTAQNIRDLKAASYGYGYRGQLYERQGRFDNALQQTRLAVATAQQTHAPESLYRWQWQTGRLMRQRGELEESIKAYRRAAATLQSIRPELLVLATQSGLAFREAGGQLFFQLADVILERASVLKEPKAVQAHLFEAREAIELFKASELRDYFKDNCVDAFASQTTTLEKVSRRTAVLYPIILPDRTELLLSYPDEIQRYTVMQKAEVLVEEVRVFRRLLEKRSTRQYLPHAQQLYVWLIRPLEASLNAHEIETLVIVPDGALRTIPFSALHDGKQFLIERYAVATTPGLNLTDPHSLPVDRIRVFSAGLTEGVQGFSPLPNVRLELQALESLFASNPLVNGEFRMKNIERSMEKGEFSVVHIATHGQFASRVEDTFLLTFDDKLTMDRLSQLIGLFRYREEPLELLTLSACETAAGDDRAALGLAGVAIKAGARSALATLWFINDQASSLLVEAFYQELHQPKTSKVVALQRAQLKLLQNPAYQHPAYWAPFLLLNNWL